MYFCRNDFKKCNILNSVLTEEDHEPGESPGPGAQSQLHHDGVGQGCQQGTSQGWQQPTASVKY